VHAKTNKRVLLRKRQVMKLGRSPFNSMYVWQYKTIFWLMKCCCRRREFEMALPSKHQINREIQPSTPRIKVVKTNNAHYLSSKNPHYYGELEETP
jgi:hypothetical protein